MKETREIPSQLIERHGLVYDSPTRGYDWTLSNKGEGRVVISFAPGEYYQKELGLMGWDLTFRHEDIESFASCRCDADQRWCVIKLCTDWGNGKDKPLTRCELDISAFHEVLHLRLGELRWLAKSRFTTMDEIDRADEDIVTALENFHRAHY